MYSVAVNKISVTANIVQYNGTLCSGAVISYTKTYSKGICALGNTGRRTLTDRFIGYASNVMHSAVDMSKHLLPFSTSDHEEVDEKYHDVFDEADDFHPILPHDDTVAVAHRNLRGVSTSLASSVVSEANPGAGTTVVKSAVVNPNTRIQTATFSTALPNSVNGVYMK